MSKSNIPPLNPTLACSYTSHQLELPECYISIHYVKAGAKSPISAKDGRVIVLIHGWPDLWYGWRHQIPALADKGWLIIVPDMRGYGLTKFINHNNNNSIDINSIRNYTFKNQVQDIIAILDHEQIRSATVIGHDWGGAVAWQCVRRFPNRINAVGSICTPYRPKKKNYVSPEQIAKMMPHFYYHVYFSNSHEPATKELESNIRRSFLAIFRSHKKTEKVGSLMNSNSKGFLSAFPKEIPRSSVISENELDYYVKMYEYTGFKHSLYWYATSKINFDEDETQQIQLNSNTNNNNHNNNNNNNSNNNNTNNNRSNNNNNNNANISSNNNTSVVKLPAIISAPSLIITCGHDPVIKPQMSIGMENWCINLTRAHIEDSAHWAMIEQPQQVNNIIIKWISSLPPTNENSIPPPKYANTNTNNNKTNHTAKL